MKKNITKKTGSLKVLALVLGFAVSGIIIGQGVSQNDSLISEGSSLDSLKETIKSNKNMIVNTYLLGVSIYKETVE
ncbi:hypothetical protein [Ekhidna sp.]|uniref:hypothetical protein n=1 Tax=Ekhidna sp. TaxID=2608089 RepID=UPI003BA97799